MRVCVVGSGGREHALADVLSRAGDEVVVSPGNAGIPNSVPTDPGDIDADLFVIGPEVPLVAGLADRLRAQGKATFGPGADGARLEGSKRWMKQVLDEAGVPTARHRSFTDADEARSFLRTLSPPWVVKTDGLAAGKGVLVTTDRAEAEADVEAKLSGRAFGDAGRRIVIEEGLSGPELSVLAVCDGTTGPRTSSAWATGTAAPTPVAWVPTRRCPSPPTPWSTRCWRQRCCPPWRPCAGGGSTTGACSTPG
jgi:phosphoribosylamine---glycine ligase